MKNKALVTQTACSWIKAKEFKSLIWKPECEIFFFLICVRLIDTDHFLFLTSE